jgi:hypothetical protein
MRYVRGSFIAILAFAASVSSAQIASFNTPPKRTAWNVLKIGAGGFISDIDIASDGTKAIHTDTYGAYVCPAPCTPSGTPGWSQVVLMNTMPSGDPGVGLQKGAGVYEIRIAPNNTSRLYMYFNGYVYRSDSGGASWNATGFSKVAASGNDQVTETFGPYIAIDPNNADIVYVGTPGAGLFKSTNAGASFSSVAAVGIGSTVPPGSTTPQGGSNIIAFDPSSSVSGGVTQGIYVSTYGVGVYRSTDGGSTWTFLNSTGMPTTHQHIICVSDGMVYFVDNSGNLKKYSGGAWSTVSTGLSNPRAVAVDPANLSRIVVINDIGQTRYSSNGGTSWTGTQTPSRVAIDIPWLQNTNETNLAPGNIVFDPSQSNVLYVAEGIGVWHSNPAPGSGLTWSSQSAGIEQLVALWAISPPGGNPILTFMDRPVFTITDPNAYPSQHGLNYAYQIIHGYSADWASSSPRTIAVVAEQGYAHHTTSGYSSNGGGADGSPSNWSVFSGISQITDLVDNGGSSYGGGIAAASSTNFVWVLSNATAGGSTRLWVTQDGGAHWFAPTISGVAASPNSGWGNNPYLDRQIVAADRVSPNTFYAYNQGASSTAGVYKSTDGGSTWLRVYTRTLGKYTVYNAQMRAVPGEAGNIFFTAGSQVCPCPTRQSFYKSTNGGTTWSTVANVQDVWTFGFGKAKPGSDGYPALYLYGWVNGIGGLWRADNIDATPTWTQLTGLYPLNRFDQVKVVEGDNNTFGTVYVGFAGSGFIYGHLN